MTLRRFKYGCCLQESLFKGEQVVVTPSVLQSYLAALNCDSTVGDRRRDPEDMRYMIGGVNFSIQFQEFPAFFVSTSS